MSLDGVCVHLNVQQKIWGQKSTGSLSFSGSGIWLCSYIKRQWRGKTWILLNPLSWFTLLAAHCLVFVVVRWSTFHVENYQFSQLGSNKPARFYWASLTSSSARLCRPSVVATNQSYPLYASQAYMLTNTFSSLLFLLLVTECYAAMIRVVTLTTTRI